MASKDLRSIVEGYFEEHYLSSYFWVEERIQGSKIEIFIDSDEGVSYEVCTKVSRTIEAVIDETKQFGEKYTLEVSSPGVGSPLLLKRQYIKNVGRTIEVAYGDPTEKVKGTLISADDAEIKVSYEVTEKEGKKKIKKEVVNTIGYDQINQAKIKISF